MGANVGLYLAASAEPPISFGAPRATLEPGLDFHHKDAATHYTYYIFKPHSQRTLPSPYFVLQCGRRQVGTGTDILNAAVILPFENCLEEEEEEKKQS